MAESLWILSMKEKNHPHFDIMEMADKLFVFSLQIICL